MDSVLLMPLMSFSTNCIVMVANKLKNANIPKAQSLPRASKSCCVTSERIKMNVNSTKLAHATLASSATSATYVKKKLP